MSRSSTNASFRSRLSNGDKLVGTFIKTPTPHNIEIAALASLDFVTVDAEHAPFSPHELDLAMLAAKAADIDVLVRISGDDTTCLQQALDLGATGIIVPHVSSAQYAAKMVSAARFSNGTRGYSNSPRAGGYGSLGMVDYLQRSHENTTVVLQIEDQAGVESVGAIAATNGVDALFIGRADLAVAYGIDGPNGQEVDEISGRIVEAAKRNGLAAAGFFANERLALEGVAQGLSMLVVGSDQMFLRKSWTEIASEIRSETGRVATDASA